MEHTNKGGKGVHSKTGPQDDEQICLGEVLLEVLEEASGQALAKEHNVGLHETLCSTAQHMVALLYTPSDLSQCQTGPLVLHS